jgi:hypothetical protein
VPLYEPRGTLPCKQQAVFDKGRGHSQQGAALGNLWQVRVQAWFLYLYSFLVFYFEVVTSGYFHCKAVLSTHCNALSF